MRFSDESASRAICAAHPEKRRSTVGEYRMGEDLTIRELAELVAEVVGSNHELIFDQTKPDGTPRKLLDVTVLQSLGWNPATSLRGGLEMTYLDYCSQLRRS